MFKQRLPLLRWLLATCLVVGGPLCASAQAPSVRSISVEGTEIAVSLGDERRLRSKDLVGAVLRMRFDGQPTEVRIANVEPDPEDRTATVWLHTFEVKQPDGSWNNLCLPGPDGRRQGFPLKDKDGAIDLTCSAGAVGKCVRFGYRPWASGPDGESLAPQHAACVRMVRGDYGGTRPFTRNGMSIDLYDLQDIQKSDMAADQTFEAGWTPDGAVCVHHPRVKENVTLEQLEAEFPRLKGRTGAVCTEDFARRHGAILFNRSKD